MRRIGLRRYGRAVGPLHSRWDDHTANPAVGRHGAAALPARPRRHAGCHPRDLRGPHARFRPSRSGLRQHRDRDPPCRPPAGLVSGTARLAGTDRRLPSGSARSAGTGGDGGAPPRRPDAGRGRCHRLRLHHRHRHPQPGGAAAGADGLPPRYGAVAGVRAGLRRRHAGPGAGRGAGADDAGADGPVPGGRTVHLGLPHRGGDPDQRGGDRPVRRRRCCGPGRTRRGRACSPAPSTPGREPATSWVGGSRTMGWA